MSEATQESWVMEESEAHGFFSHEFYIFNAATPDELAAIVNGEANARRIVAVPDMLAALEMAIDRPDWAPLRVEEREQIHTILAKAKA